MEQTEFCIELLGLNFDNSIVDNFNWKKISEGIIKKNPNLVKSETLREVKR